MSNLMIWRTRLQEMNLEVIVAKSGIITMILNSIITYATYSGQTSTKWLKSQYKMTQKRGRKLLQILNQIISYSFKRRATSSRARSRRRAAIKRTSQLVIIPMAIRWHTYKKSALRITREILLSKHQSKCQLTTAATRGPTRAPQFTTSLNHLTAFLPVNMIKIYSCRKH